MPCLKNRKNYAQSLLSRLDVVLLGRFLASESMATHCETRAFLAEATVAENRRFSKLNLEIVPPLKMINKSRLRISNLKLVPLLKMINTTRLGKPNLQLVPHKRHQYRSYHADKHDADYVKHYPYARHLGRSHIA